LDRRASERRPSDGDGTLSGRGVRVAGERQNSFRGRGKSSIFRGFTSGDFRPATNRTSSHTCGRRRRFSPHAASGHSTPSAPHGAPAWMRSGRSENGLLVMAGYPWEQHIRFSRGPGGWHGCYRENGVRAAAARPAPRTGDSVLCARNENPRFEVRWQAAGADRKFLETLIGRLIGGTLAGSSLSELYDNRVPRSSLSGLSVSTFDLETQERFARYLARLQNLAGRASDDLAGKWGSTAPHGEDRQAPTLRLGDRTALRGVRGAFVFAWTTEWQTGRWYDIEDWDFGPRGGERNSKPALESVRRAFSPETPVSGSRSGRRFSGPWSAP